MGSSDPSENEWNEGPEDGLAKEESSGPSGSEWNVGPENGLSEGGSSGNQGSASVTDL